MVQILEEDVPAAAAPETQEVGPSQPIVSTSVNIPKPRDSKPKSVYARFINPEFGIATIQKQPGQMKQPVIRKSIRDIVLLEAHEFYEFVHDKQGAIMTKVNQGTFDLSEWWAEHQKKFPKLAIVVKNLLCIPATSANCERAFSTLTDVVSKKRNID